MKSVTKKSCLVLACVGIIFSFSYLQKRKTRTGEKMATVRVCQVVEHEALDAVVQGLKEVITQDSPCKVIVENCQGNGAMAAQILEKFANSPTDVCVTIGTLPSQVAYKIAKSGRLKVVFASVTNPTDIAPEIQNTNMTGVSNFVDLRPQLDLFLKLQPELKTLGMIYNTAEANSVYIVKAMEPLCKEKGLQLITQGISKISELWQAAEKILKTADAVFISNDNLVLSCMENLCALCAKRRVPVYVSDTDQVEKGCVAALGPNQVEIGRQTGFLVRRILKGEDINSIAIEYPLKTELVVNTAKAPFLIPHDIVEHADKVY